EKIAETRAIRALFTPKIRSLIDPDKRKQVDDLLGDDELTVVTADQLPAPFKSGLQERDGAIDRAVLVFPKTANKKKMWEGTSMTSFTATLRALGERARGGGDTAARAAGSVPLTSDLVGYIEHDGPVATFLALAGVVGLVIAMFGRSRSTFLVITSLLTGVLFLFAATVSARIKINFANFIAFPITFGIGVDYAVNLVARWEQLRATGEPLDEKMVLEAIRATGGAVGLCSMTTIIGYSSLLLAENRALFSFGVLAVFGELCCITTAIVAMPAFVLLAQRWLTKRSASKPVRGA
ncbi:MAG: MMPL family transporter, partial [Polyangiales bacterium]